MVWYIFKQIRCQRLVKWQLCFFFVYLHQSIRAGIWNSRTISTVLIWMKKTTCIISSASQYYVFKKSKFTNWQTIVKGVYSHFYLSVSYLTGQNIYLYKLISHRNWVIPVREIICLPEILRILNLKALKELYPISNRSKVFLVGIWFWHVFFL